MGRGGIGGAAAMAMAMETADPARAFVKDVKRIIIKVIGLPVSLFFVLLFIVSSCENAETFLSLVALRAAHVFCEVFAMSVRICEGREFDFDPISHFSFRGVLATVFFFFKKRSRCWISFRPKRGKLFVWDLRPESISVGNGERFCLSQALLFQYSISRVPYVWCLVVPVNI